MKKTSNITLRAGTSTLTLLATARKDGTAVTTVVTRDTEKKTSSRGMTTTHASMQLAVDHLAVLAKKSVALGWVRGKFGAGRVDQFDTLPSPNGAKAKK